MIPDVPDPLLLGRISFLSMDGHCTPAPSSLQLGTTPVPLSTITTCFSLLRSSLSSSFSHVCVCVVCTSIHMGVVTCTCTGAGQRSVSEVSRYCSPLYFLEKVSHWTRSSPFQWDWLPRKLSPPSFLCPSTRVSKVHRRAQLLCGCWESSCLDGKHFTHRAISSAQSSFSCSSCTT